MIRKSLNKEHHEVCSCFPHAHWGSAHSHEASTMKEAEGEGVTEEGASDCTGDSITIDIVWPKKHKNVKKEKSKREHKQLYKLWRAGLRTGRRCLGHTAGGAQWTGRFWPLG